MTTDVMRMIHTQVAELRQLVLFPEIFGYRSVPLDQCRQAETARDDEPDGHQRSLPGSSPCSRWTEEREPARPQQ